MKKNTPKKMTQSTAKKKKFVMRTKGFIALCVLAAAALIILLSVCYEKYAVISQFEMVGNVEYTPEEAEMCAKELGIERGMHLYEFDAAKAEKCAVYALGSFDEVKIKRSLPSKVILKVKEASPCMIVYRGNEAFVLSESLKVLERITDKTKAERMMLVNVSFGEHLQKALVGSPIVCDEGYTETLTELYGILQEENMLSDVDVLDVSNLFDLQFGYKGRYTVRLGGNESLALKVRFLQSIMEKAGEDSSGYVDVSDDTLRKGNIKSY